MVELNAKLGCVGQEAFDVWDGAPTMQSGILVTSAMVGMREEMPAADALHRGFVTRTDTCASKRALADTLGGTLQ